jgi:hypothetical protein
MESRNVNLSDVAMNPEVAFNNRNFAMNQSHSLRLLANLSIAASTAIATVTMAASPGNAAVDKPFPSYHQLDKDRNGVVTLPEIDVYPAAVAKRIHRCDMNHDAKLTAHEYAACEQVKKVAIKPAR